MVVKKVVGPRIATKTRPLKCSQLKWQCPQSLVKISKANLTKTSDEQQNLLGQHRALKSLMFGLEMDASGFNVFVYGSKGSGRHKSVMEFISRKARHEPTPQDWVYVQNFDIEHKPIAIPLADGEASKLKAEVEKALKGITEGLPKLLENSEIKSRIRKTEQEFRDESSSSFSKIQDLAEKASIAIAPNPNGFSLIPVTNSKPIEKSDFDKLPKAQQDAFNTKMSELQELIANYMTEEMPHFEKVRREKQHNLYQELATNLVKRNFKSVREQFPGNEKLSQHLDAIEEDLAGYAPHLSRLATQASKQGSSEDQLTLETELRRYEINVLVSISEKGAPVIYEDWPGLGRLLGRIEHILQMGALETDFQLIKAGSLHRANGGYLLLDANRILSSPGSWETLKRALRTKQISIESPYQSLSSMTTVTLEPESIPLNTKVILFGDRRTYYLLAELDPDFSQLFKVAAEFEDSINRTPASVRAYAKLLDRICFDEGLTPLSLESKQLLVETAIRKTSDKSKLTLQISPLADLLRAANHYSALKKRKEIDTNSVRIALEDQDSKIERIKRLSYEAIEKGRKFIDLNGSKVGQINALSVMSIGESSFGQPTRITARTRLGNDKMIDVERQVELGGALHSKGVIILTSYLAATYALDHPIALRASLVFEQSYGGIDGDSASSAELYALLSSLSNLPINQFYAVTGSVNQFGEIQPVGGVNEKIEGFFDVCKLAKTGLTGNQGVLIPATNVNDLMLKDEVVSACAEGKFSVWPIASIDQGIHLLTGVKPGERSTTTGKFPKNSVNRFVEDKLIDFSLKAKKTSPKISSSFSD